MGDLLELRASGRYGTFPLTAPRRIRTVHAGTLAGEAIRTALDGSNPAGTVLVTAPDKKGEARIVGALAEKDYLVSLQHGSYAPTDVTAEQIMGTGLPCATIKTPAVQVLRAMLQLGRRHVPVLSPTAPLLSLAGDAQALRDATSSGIPLSQVDSVISMRELVAFLQDKVFSFEKARGVSEEALAVGVMARRAAAASGMAPADAAAIAAAAAVASEEEVANAASSGSGSGSSGSALTGADDDREGGLSWRLRAEDLLGCMATGGADILLNTRLDDNITVADAANVMASQSMSCVAVVDDAGRAAGVFTSRDFLTRVLLPGRDATSTLVREVMSTHPVCAPLERSVLRCSRSMVKRGFRHLLIVNRLPAGDAASTAEAAAAAAAAASTSADATAALGAEHEHAEEESTGANVVVGLISMADVARAYVAGIDGLMAAAGVSAAPLPPSLAKRGGAAVTQRDSVAGVTAWFSRKAARAKANAAAGAAPQSDSDAEGDYSAGGIL